MSALAKHTRAGFTLMEILVAITLLAVILSIVTTSFVSVMNTTEMARTNARDLYAKQRLRDHFMKNLVSVCAQADYAFTGTNEEGIYGPADTLEYCTVATAGGGLALPGTTRVISYAVVEAQDIEDYPLPDEDREEAVLEILQQPLIQTQSFFSNESDFQAPETTQPTLIPMTQKKKTGLKNGTPPPPAPSPGPSG